MGIARGLAVLSIGVLPALATAACGSSSSSDSGQSDSAIKIAVITSLSGDSAAGLGEPTKDAVEAFEKAHPTVDGKKLEFKFMDDQSDPTKASALANTVATDKSYLAVIGPSASAMLFAAAPVLLQGGVPTMGVSPATEDQLNNKYYFAPNSYSLKDYVTGGVPLFKSMSIQPSQYAYVIENGATAAANDPILKAAGIPKFVVDAGLADYSTAMAKLKSDGYKGLWVNNSERGGYARKAEVDMGWDAPFVTPPNTFNEAFLRQAGDSANGVIAMTQVSMVDPSNAADADVKAEAEKFQAAVKQESGETAFQLGIASSIAWDQSLSLYDAVDGMLQGKQDISRDSLVKTLQTQTFAGAGGRVTRKPGGNDFQSGFAEGSPVYAKWTDGQLEIVKLGS